MPLVKRPPRFDHVDAADDMPVSKIKIAKLTVVMHADDDEDGDDDDDGSEDTPC